MPEVKILYVEDEPTLAQIVKDTLERSGYHVLLVSDGAKVIAQIQQFQPHICVLDVMLPHVDGFTLGDQIRKLVPDLPIIYLTAKNRTADVVQGFKSGGNDYLRKPFSMEELIVRIENLLSFQGREKNQPTIEKIQNWHLPIFPAKVVVEAGSKRKEIDLPRSGGAKGICGAPKRGNSEKTFAFRYLGG